MKRIWRLNTAFTHSMASFFQAKGQCIALAVLIMPVLVTPALAQGSAGTYSVAVNNLLDQGCRDLSNDKPREARVSFLRALIKTPGNAEALAYIGVSYCDEAFQNDDPFVWIQALEFLEKALALDPNVKSGALLFYQASALRALGLRLHERAAWSELVREFPSSQYIGNAKQMLREGRPKIDIEALNGIAKLMEPSNPYAALVAFTEVVVVAKDGGTPALLNDSAFGLIRLWNRTQQHEKVLRLKRKLRNLLEPRIAAQVAIAEISLGRCPQAEALLAPLEGVAGFEAPLASLWDACRLVRNHQARGGNQELDKLNRALYNELLTYTTPKHVGGRSPRPAGIPISSGRR